MLKRDIIDYCKEQIHDTELAIRIEREEAKRFRATTPGLISYSEGKIAAYRDILEKL